MDYSRKLTIFRFEVFFGLFGRVFLPVPYFRIWPPKRFTRKSGGWQPPGAQVERLANCRENCQSWTDCFSPCFRSREKKKFHALCQKKSAKHQISTNPFFNILKSNTYIVLLWKSFFKKSRNKSHYLVMFTFNQVLKLKHLQ